MWTRVFSKIYPGISKEDVWYLWTQIDNWPQWHGDLDYCKLEGEFAVGSHFWLKPKNMKKPVKILITEVILGKQFTDCTVFWGAKMYDTHALEETPEGLKLTNTLQVTGPLSWLWIKLVAENVAASVPEEMESLVRLCKSKNKEREP